MEKNKEIEEFVKEWKRELSSCRGLNNSRVENKSSPGDKQIDIIPGSSVNPVSLHSSGRIKTVQGKTENVHSPFGIIGNLPNPDKNAGIIVTRLESNTHHSELNHHNLGSSKKLFHPSKRKLLEPSENAKKWKQAHMKDIFVERKTDFVPTERLLDRLIADIDEITEIPFFDITLPREVAIQIFQYLSLTDLCSCAQVSKGWRSLADDEWLWCRICHGLGQEKIYSSREKTNWKQIVQHNIERQRLLVTNWKGRIGQLSHLEHTKGKILCAVDSCGDIVAAGYTSGEVKLWDLSNEDACVFQPSDTSLLLSTQGEGQVPNIVETVVTSQRLTAASYTHGNIDIWSLDAGTQPIHTYSITARQFSIENLCMSRTRPSLAVSYGTYVDILHQGHSSEPFSCRHHINNDTRVLHLKILETEGEVPPVVIGKQNIVNIYHPGQPTGHMTEIHNLICADIQVLDVKTDPCIVAVGLGYYRVTEQGYKVLIYDAHKGGLFHTLQGYPSTLSAINLHDTPPHMLVIAAGDQGCGVSIHDFREEGPVMSLLGNSRKITSVQMDEWKVVAGRHDGFVSVWDLRMAAKLWEWHNRHPVRYCHFDDKTLIVGNVADEKFPQTDHFEFATHRRYRGSVQAYNFLADQMTQGVPEICLSTYDHPDASKYNIALATPYDTLNF